MRDRLSTAAQALVFLAALAALPTLAATDTLNTWVGVALTVACVTAYLASPLIWLLVDRHSRRR